MSASVERTLAEISDWSSAYMRMLDGPGERCEAIVNRLREAGLPVARFMVAARSLHPQADGFGVLFRQTVKHLYRRI